MHYTNAYNTVNKLNFTLILYFTYPSIYLSFYFNSMHQSISICTYISLPVYIYLSIFLSIHLYVLIYLLAYLSNTLSLNLSYQSPYPIKDDRREGWLNGSSEWDLETKTQLCSLLYKSKYTGCYIQVKIALFPCQ